MLRLPAGLQVPVAGSVQFRARKTVGIIISPLYQHLAIGQQRRRMINARGVEVPCGTPGCCDRVVEFLAGKRAAARTGP